MNPLIAAAEWLPMDTQIVVVAALCGMSCALLGSFLVLRRMSMMGDAISHAVLPGLAIAFLLTGSRSSLTMLCGAALVGLLTAAFTQWIHSAGRVDEGASMGVVFTVLFAIGLVLIRRFADHVDLDPDCVLNGAIELVPLDQVRCLGVVIPRAALAVGGVFVLNLLCVTLLFKEFRISAFDPALATTLGIDARRMHYLLMALVAVTTVAAFESVGSILVIAMLIVPPATAHLLTDRLGPMVVIGAALASLSAAGGHWAAIHVPGWLGYDGVSTSTAGMIAAFAGALFAVALAFSPRHGLVSRAAHHVLLALRIAREDVLGALYRLEERPDAGRDRCVDALVAAGGAGRLMRRAAVWALRRDGSLRCTASGMALTERGREAARQLLRSHRLWETFLDAHLTIPPDHVHAPAESLEHVTSAELRERLARQLGDPTHDPQGKAIPPQE